VVGKIWKIKESKKVAKKTTFSKFPDFHGFLLKKFFKSKQTLFLMTFESWSKNIKKEGIPFFLFKNSFQKNPLLFSWCFQLFFFCCVLFKKT
jgi:hypothetical protein